MIELASVERRFAGAGGLRTTSLVIAKGERLSLVGASGSGKSTLLRLVVGLLRPDRGAVRIGGTVMSPETALGLRRTMGYVIQDGGLFPHLTAEDNVLLVARHVGWDEARCRARLS